PGSVCLGSHVDRPIDAHDERHTRGRQPAVQTGREAEEPVTDVALDEVPETAGRPRRHVLVHDIRCGRSGHVPNVTNPTDNRAVAWRLSTSSLRRAGVSTILIGLRRDMAWLGRL